MADTVAWETVRRAAEGDAGAQRDLVKATLDGLWALAMRLTRHRDEADDVVQETYARVFTVLPVLEPTGRFEGYLARIATNLVLERWRRERPQMPPDDAVISPADLEPWQTVADREDEQRQLGAIWAAIGRLEPEPRAAILLFYAQCESCNRIARILDVPVGTVKTWLHRGRNSVRQTAESLLGRPQPESAPTKDRS
jgi:RNA polymerase sigma-70 factor (ECF subfamily)